MKQQCDIFPAGLTILVVEDESIIAWDVEQLLRDHGASEVLIAPSLKKARAFLAGHDGIGLVIVDLKLEDGNGGDLIEETAAKGIPTIITTGYDSFTGGGIPVISKPYGAKTLITAVLCAIKA